MNDPEIEVDSSLISSATALSNDIIVKKVQSYMPSRDLIQLRLVNSKWKDIASSLLLKRADLEVQLVYSTENLTYERNTVDEDKTLDNKNNKDNKNRLPTITDLNQLIENTYNFPYSKFSFHGGNCTSDSSQIKKLLELHGEKIKSLYFKWDMKSSSPLVLQRHAVTSNVNNIIRILHQNQVHNLNYLHLGGFLSNYCSLINSKSSKSEKIDNSSEPNIFLPSVKILNLSGLKIDCEHKCVDSDVNFIDILLKALPNLTTTLGFPAEFVENFASNRKLDTIKSFNFIPTVSNAQKLLTYASTKPKLVELGLHLENIYNSQETWRTVISALHQILNSSRLTMTKINHFHPLGFFKEAINIPIMEVLDTVEFGDLCSQFAYRPETSYMFPQEFKMDRDFPVLKNIKFRLTSDRGLKPSSVRKYFKLFWEVDTYGPIPSVTHFEINHQIYEIDIIKSLSQLFPSLESLSIGNISHLETLARGLFENFQSLVSLKLNVDALRTWNTYKNRPYFFDSVMTGMREKCCNDFRMKSSKDENKSSIKSNHYNKNYQAFDRYHQGARNSKYYHGGGSRRYQAQSIREFPSIRNMTKLKHLVLEVTELTTLVFLSEIKLMSRVSVLHGFQLVPSLKVRIVLNELKGLDHDSEERAKILAKFSDVPSFGLIHTNGSNDD